MKPRFSSGSTFAILFRAVLATTVPAAAGAQAPPPPPAVPDTLGRADARGGRLAAPQAVFRNPLDAEAAALVGGEKLPPAAQIADLKARIAANARDPELYNRLGLLHVGLNEWQPARDAFISAVQINPRKAEYHRNLALVLGHLGATSLAVPELNTYQKLDPAGGLDAWRLMGEAYAQVGQTGPAREAFETALARVPGDKGDERMLVVLDLARLAGTTEGAAAARARLEAHLAEAHALIAAAGAPGDTNLARPARRLVSRLVAGYGDEAKAQLAAGQPALAGPLYEQAYDLAPERDDLLLGAIGAYLDAGRKDQLHALAQRATTARPQAAESWLAAGRVAEAEGDTPGGIKAYEQAVALGSTRPDLKLRLGNLYLKAGDGANARKYLADAVSDPKTPPATLYAYAVSLIRDQKYNLATGPLRRAVKADPQLAPAWTELARCLWETKQYAEAADAYRHALAIGPDTALSLNLAVCLNRLGKPEEAIAALRAAVRADSTATDAQYAIARTLLDAGRYDEAMPELQATLKLDPQNAPAYLGVGLCWYKQADFPKAIEAFKQSLARRETSAARQNLGLAYEQMGMKEQAAKCYADAKKLKAAGK